MVSAETIALIELGEGQTIEFKESPSKIDREIVAFANASGGAIYCGISDKGNVTGTPISNKIKSEIQDVARNCDPPIFIRIDIIDKVILKITVPESDQKPHQCSSGFFIRMGANTQKLKTSEVLSMKNKITENFDSLENRLAKYPNEFKTEVFNEYCRLSGISLSRQPKYLLESMHAIVSKNNKEFYFTNAGSLLFTEMPSKYFPETILTAVRYRESDKFSIIDRKDFKGNLLAQIAQGLEFAKKHIEVEYEISGEGARLEHFRYPLVAIREALINAVMHRDYRFQNSCIYLNIYSDRLEIENPGGIPGNLKPEEVFGKSARRNPLLADLLYRGGFGEKLGSGLIRIARALKENNNPPYQIAASNFFSIRFLPRIAVPAKKNISLRQGMILQILNESNRKYTASDLARRLNISSATANRELKLMQKAKLIKISGVGKATRYEAT